MPAQAGYVIAEKKDLDRLHDKIARLVSEPISKSAEGLAPVRKIGLV
jgi:hypothetical protein